jgi:DNA-binding CsgD family transcriptional regulator
MRSATARLPHHQNVREASPAQPSAGGELRNTLLRLTEATRALSSLTAREMQCLCLCAEGKSYWESGVILGISERTVSYHMEAVRSKLGAATNAHAVALIWTSLVGT